MFTDSSRYYSLPTLKFTAEDGREIAYKARRFLPRSDEIQAHMEVVITQGDRLDIITARTLGDPEHFWRLCDANRTMNPAELVNDDRIGERMVIPYPGFEGEA